MERISDMHKVLCLVHPNEAKNSPSCDDCIKGEMHWSSFPKGCSWRAVPLSGFIVISLVHSMLLALNYPKY